MGSSQGPIPTGLVALSELTGIALGNKVRFLGCVTNYDIPSAALTLEHRFPAGRTVKANVDINLLLGSLESTDTHIGEWVNVMGYIQPAPLKPTITGKFLSDVVFVQAIALWSAGSIKLQDYEEALGKRSFKSQSREPPHHDP